MQIRFLYYEDCPSHEAALERLQQVMTEENITAPVEVVKVETDAQAEALQFAGSPTIQVNGADIVPPDGQVIYGLSCRVYVHEDGRYSPLPSPATIRRALREADVSS